MTKAFHFPIDHVVNLRNLSTSVRKIILKAFPDWTGKLEAETNYLQRHQLGE